MSPYFQRHCSVVPATELAVAFPPSKGYHGAATTIADLDRHGLYSGHLGVTPTLQAAVSLITSRNLQSSSYGHGNAANRRAKQLST